VAIFGQIGFGQNLVVLGKIGPGQNLVESSQVDLDWNFVKSTLAQIWSRRPDRNSFESHLSSSHAENWPRWPDKKIVKFYRVSPMDTSFKKFNLNLFYEKWILDFEFDPNI